MGVVFQPDGDLFDSHCEVLVCTVNVVGAMGRGVALECRKRWPAAFHDYQRACADGRLRIGTVAWVALEQARSPRALLLFPTKLHYRNPSQLAYVTSGLRDFCDRASSQPYCSYAFPKLGCGFGGLDWGVVSEHMVRFLLPTKLEITIFGSAPPGFAPTALPTEAIPARQLDLFASPPSDAIDSLPRDAEALRSLLRGRRKDDLVDLAVDSGLLVSRRAKKEEAIARLVEYRLHRAGREKRSLSIDS